MKTGNWALIALSAALLSGCATRGSLAMKCDGFKDFITELKPSQLVQDIQSDVAVSIDLMRNPATMDMAPRFDSGPDPLAASLRALTDGNTQAAAMTGRGDGPPPRAALLLSGGGQWGAFGAGFLSKVQTDPRTHIDFGVITGVSTGGLQSLFLAIDDEDAYRRLRIAYAPENEKQVVKRNPKALAVVTGSLAGLAPLRKRIEAALCTGGDAAKGCPMIDKLAASGRNVFIGFVEAKSGTFYYADAKAIAESAQGGGPQRRNAQQCLTGVALASAAMPVFFQQVKIGDHAYYDGGVRQSVFEENISGALDAAVQSARADARRRSGNPAASQAIAMPALYVVRNGPTQLLGDKGKPEDDVGPDSKADALTAAFRAEAIVVNQLEVGSIAALRLSHPTGAINLVTADGYHRWLTPPDAGAFKGCDKPKDVMFDPTFMGCLQRLGEWKAARRAPQSPWISLSPLAIDTAAEATRDGH